MLLSSFYCIGGSSVLATCQIIQVNEIQQQALSEQLRNISVVALTVNQVFSGKHLWAWFNSPVTNSYDGVSEKGEDYASSYGTPIAVPIGGTIKRIVHHTNSIGDVVELMADDGSVWLYQHISSRVRTGDILHCGGIIGTENGLPIDEFSTGPHIEVRYIPPLRWNPNIDSWLEGWINPRSIFSGVGNQEAGTVQNTFGTALLSFTIGGSQSKISLSPNTDVTDLLVTFDTVLELINPFANIQAAQDSFGSFTFTDPVAWLEGFGLNIVEDLTALVLRIIFLFIGAAIILKVLNNFIDIGSVLNTVESGMALL